MKAKFYLIPNDDAVIDVVNALKLAGVARPVGSMMVEVERADAADALGRLLGVLDQPFDLVYPTPCGQPDELDQKLEDQFALRMNAIARDWTPAEDDHSAEIPAAVVPVLAEARAVEITVPEPEVKPVVTTTITLNGQEGRPCAHCGEIWFPRRKDMQYCPKEDCQRAKKTETQGKWRSKKNGKAAHEPSDADLREAEAFEQVLAEEIANDPAARSEPAAKSEPAPRGEAADEAPADEAPSEQPEQGGMNVEAEGAQPGGEAPKADPVPQAVFDYEIRTGKNRGQRLTRYQLEAALAINEMQPGQFLRHTQTGFWFEVRQGGKAQKIIRTGEPHRAAA